ncbi:hypothetical protein EIL50_00990 [bacterium NHP-B]|nr:hypothetical protein EIL50_00990 [bacterium NHP-B]
MIQRFLKLIHHVHAFPKRLVATSVKPYEGLSDKAHQFVTFLKPDLLHTSGSLCAILEAIHEHYRDWDIHIQAARVFSGAFLQQRGLIERNYETLDNVSREGLCACSEKVKNAIAQQFTQDIDHVLGGHQLLEHFSDLTPSLLRKMTDHHTTHKLGSGVYGFQTLFEDKPLLCLNAFYPFLLSSLTPLGGTLIAFLCSSNHPWDTLRNHFVGGIDPKQATLGSLRRKLFEYRKPLSLLEVNVAHNMIHISPGPLEALRHINIFFDAIKTSQTSFGHCLAKKGFSAKDITFLLTNPCLRKNHDQETSALFEHTENQNATDVLSLLETLKQEGNLCCP